MEGTQLAWSPDGRTLVISQRLDVEARQSSPYPVRTWLLDFGTGELREVPTPVDTWQRLEA